MDGPDVCYDLIGETSSRQYYESLLMALFVYSLFVRMPGSVIGAGISSVLQP